jgi:hypothetical protein
MAILHGYAADGSFVAIDTATKAAVQGFKGSNYWRAAHDDRDAAAADMIKTALELRDMIPDLPSVQPDAWNANYITLAQLITK